MEAETIRFLQAIYNRQREKTFQGYVDILKLAEETGIKADNLVLMTNELLMGTYIESYVSPPLPSGGHQNVPRAIREQFFQLFKVTQNGVNFLNDNKSKVSKEYHQTFKGNLIIDSNIHQGDNITNKIYNIKLDPNQVDLLIFLLLQQLGSSGIPKSDLEEIQSTYSDLSKELKTGSHRKVSSFISKIMSKLNEISTHVKDNPHYIGIVNLFLTALKFIDLSGTNN